MTARSTTRTGRRSRHYPSAAAGSVSTDVVALDHKARPLVEAIPAPVFPEITLPAPEAADRVGSGAVLDQDSDRVRNG